MTPSFCLCHPQNRDIEVNFFGPKNENGRNLFRAPRWKSWHLSFTCTSPRNRDIEKKILERKTKMVAHCLGHRFSTVDNSLLPVQTTEIEILKKNFLDRKTKMLAFCSGHRVGTVDTSLSPVRPQEIEISKKNLDRKTKMVAHCLGPRVSTVEISILPVQTPDIEILKKIFFDRKTKCSHTVQRTALEQLTPPFQL